MKREDLLPLIGNSKLSKLGMEVFSDVQRLFNLDDTQALRVTKSWMIDIGRIHAASDINKATYGKPNKDRLLNVKLSMTGVKTTLSMALSIVATGIKIDEARQSFGCLAIQKYSLRDEVMNWIDQKEVQVEETVGTGN